MIDFLAGYQALDRQRGLAFNFLELRFGRSLYLIVISVLAPSILTLGILLSLVSDLWWLVALAGNVMLLVSAGLTSAWIGRIVSQEHFINDMQLVSEDLVSIRLDTYCYVMTRFASGLVFFYFSYMLLGLLEQFYRDLYLETSLWFRFLPTLTSLIVPFVIWKCLDKGLGYGYPISLALYDSVEAFLRRLRSLITAHRIISTILIMAGVICPALAFGTPRFNVQVFLWTVSAIAWAVMLVVFLCLLIPLTDEERTKRAAYLNWRLENRFQRQRE